jgi:hypothetical protein
MADSAQDFPVHLASRLVLDSISYSNSLPPWQDGIYSGFASRAPAVRAHIKQYLAGRKPTIPFVILVPKKGGAKKRWLMPSVMDQIALQAAASMLGESLANRTDAKRVFSYRYNRDPNRVQFCESQVSSWLRFQNATRQRLTSCPDCLLQFDLRAAFQSINRDAFFDFLKKTAPVKSVAAADLLRQLIGSYGAGEDGLPLINDTVFFLGNAYLSVVDEIVKRHAPDFIRFVDDYRVFGKSRRELETQFASISRELNAIGFTVNMAKVKLGSANEYLDAVSRVGAAKTEADGHYISAAVFDDVLNPSSLVELIRQAVENPADRMTEGLGRLILGAIRRMRLNAEVAVLKNYVGSPLDRFDEALGRERDLLEKAGKLFAGYVTDKSEEWRAVWMAYVFSEGVTASTKIPANNVSPVVRKWVSMAYRGAGFGQTIEPISDLGYLEQAGINS